jgi:glycosyltransferase involved in cell wall biosynthesis
MTRDKPRSSIRVVHVSSAHPAGDGRIYQKECTSLAQAGYDVRLVATGVAPDAAPFPVVALPRSNRRLVRMSLGVARAVLRAVRMRPRIVHLHDPELIPAIPLLRLLGIRVVFDSHEHIAASMTHKPYLPGVLGRVARRASTVLVSMADRVSSGIVVATPAIATEFGNDRKAVIQNFPILTQLAGVEDVPRSPHQLVFIGALTEGRGAFQMLEAVDRLAETHQARLALAGTINPALLARMEAHPGWEHTDYVGVLDRAGLARLLAQSTVGLVLFLPEPNHVKSQPTKMFEYMDAGLPVLASDYPLWRELVLDPGTGLVADPLDVDEIVRAAGHLLEHPAECAEMGERGRRLVESTRNWHVEAEHLVSFYDELSGATGPAQV